VRERESATIIIEIRASKRGTVSKKKESKKVIVNMAKYAIRKREKHCELDHQSSRWFFLGAHYLE
jgi:hypothetical protein